MMIRGEHINLIIIAGLFANNVLCEVSTTEIDITQPPYIGHDNVTATAEPTEVIPQPVPFLLVVSRHIMYKVGVAIHRYYLPVIVVLGIVGNSLSLAVMTRPHNRQISCCLYMSALAVSDNINLFIGGYYWSVTDAPPPVGRKIIV